MSFKAGFIGLIGEPNAGKSTLMNFFVKEKVSIVSPKPQTTRRRILGILTNDDGQIIFVDAPGILKAKDGLNAFLEYEALEVIRESDALIAVLSLDTEKKETIEDIISLVSKSKKPWIAMITKTDLIEKSHRLLMIKELVEKNGGKCFSLSLTDPDYEQERPYLIEQCMSMLPESNKPLYDSELYTPESLRNLACEIVREKCFEFCHQEIPYNLAVRIIKYDETTHRIPHLYLEIIVAKDNHKGIVIGKGATNLKQIGVEARKDIERITGEKIFMDIKVSCKENWFNNEQIMKELGYYHEKRRV